MAASCRCLREQLRPSARLARVPQCGALAMVQSHRERLESLEARDDAFGPQGGLMPPESVVWCLRKLRVNQWAVSEREARQAQLRASV